MDNSSLADRADLDSLPILHSADPVSRGPAQHWWETGTVLLFSQPPPPVSTFPAHFLPLTSMYEHPVDGGDVLLPVCCDSSDCVSRRRKTIVM
jgi:hypothetical protein